MATLKTPGELQINIRWKFDTRYIPQSTKIVSFPPSGCFFGNIDILRSSEFFLQQVWGWSKSAILGVQFRPPPRRRWAGD
jgi:hypothetical protein